MNFPIGLPLPVLTVIREREFKVVLLPLAAQIGTDPVHIGENLPVRFEHTGFMIGHIVRFAKGFGDLAGFAQIAAGHIGVEMVLKLVV